MKAFMNDMLDREIQRAEEADDDEVTKEVMVIVLLRELCATMGTISNSLKNIEMNVRPKV